ncbi:uncharacterized protein LOC119737288 isoform X2 [Patiria miniata]|uniref:SWIM-type domain-containing protein n=1 Tax=Patiria miniata TaxID=46514 RepID=A0A914AUJ1_PATMI|nr:uncharacterized protein LOC119737288 isoform X2 [Patiria miniata]
MLPFTLDSWQMCDYSGEMASRSKAANPCPMEETSHVRIPTSSKPQVGMKFNSYLEVERFIREHEEANYVKFKKLDCRTVECSRKRAPKRYLSDKLQYATVTLSCIHQGQFKSKSTKLQPKLETQRMGCQAKFRFSATPSGMQLYLADFITQHNHPHDEASYRGLPQKRKVNDQEREESFKLLQKRKRGSAQTEENLHAMEETLSDHIPNSSKPQVGMKFSSYDEVERFIQEHEEANYVKFRKLDCRTVESNRKRMPKRYLSDELRYATVTFSCIHHGQYASQSRVRHRQKSRRIGCQAKFRFAATPSGKQLYLADFVTQHNHPHDEASFRSLPQKRKLNDQEREEAFKILQKKGRRATLKHLQEATGKAVTTRDVHNLAAASRQNSLCYTNIKAILDYLSQVEEQTSVIEVVTNADERVVGIYYQDREMIRVYASFPHYLVVDATCKNNSLQMPLYVILVEDSNCEYEIVALFFLIASNEESFRAMMRRFKENNPIWPCLQVIMADKDNSTKILVDEFPCASLQMCLSQVLRKFKQDTSKKQLGLQKEEEAFCEKLMRKLAASKSEAVYMEIYKQLLNTELQTVIKYYNTTWHNNRQEWVEGLKSRSVTLKKEDPEKLKAVSEKLVAVFKNSPTSKKVMTNLKREVESLREERDKTAAALLAENAPITNPDNTTVSKFQQYLTPCALKYVLRQLKLSWKVKVKADIDNKSMTITSSKDNMIVCVDSCPCRLWQSLCLPCSHIFAVRRTKGLPFFAKAVIGSRWSLEYYRSCSRLSAQNTDTAQSIDALQRQRLRLLSRHEKYIRVSKITKQLATVMSEAPAEQFASQLEAVQKVLTCFQNGSSVNIMEEVGQHAIDTEVITESFPYQEDVRMESLQETHTQDEQTTA